MFAQIATELLRDKCLAAFCESKQITAEKLIELMMTKRIQAKHSELSIEQYQAMMSDEHDEHWNDDGNHCLVYLGNRKNLSAEEVHTYCHRASDGIVCNKHICIPEYEKWAEDYIAGFIDLKKYRAKNTKIRLTYARTKLKPTNDVPLFMQVGKDKKAFINYTHITGCKYCKELGLVVKQTRINGNSNKYITLGIDRKNNGKISKLKLTDLRALKDVLVTVDIATVENKAIKYVNKKLINK
jgi:hypothetical protein